MAYNLKSKIEDFVNQCGPVTISQVMAKFRSYIPATAAIRSGKVFLNDQNKYERRNYLENYPLDRIVEVGKRDLVRKALRRSASQGKIRRIKEGVYGKGAVKKNSSRRSILRSKIVSWISRREHVTLDQIVAKFGREVSPEAAMRYANAYTKQRPRGDRSPEHMDAIGRRMAIDKILLNSLRSGEVRKVARGVYGAVIRLRLFPGQAS